MGRKSWQSLAAKAWTIHPSRGEHDREVTFYWNSHCDNWLERQIAWFRGGVVAGYIDVFRLTFVMRLARNFSGENKTTTRSIRLSIALWYDKYHEQNR